MRLLLVSLLLAAACLAQDTNGNIAGTVQDPSGAGVPGATVTITATERNQVVRSIKTDGDGNFSAPLLPEGMYSVTVESKGFKKSVQKDRPTIINWCLSGFRKTDSLGKCKNVYPPRNAGCSED